MGARSAYGAGVQSPTELAEAFRARGLKLTPQRHLLFRLLHDNTTHPSAEALFLAASEQMPGISLRTVYQTLNDLVTLGELQQIDFVPGSARFDPNLSDHQHLVCDACGAVRDVHLPLGPIGSGASGEAVVDFRIDSTTVVFHGRCGTCAATD
jgi:Fe2+ or Zn2+ uptake regulation protein